MRKTALNRRLKREFPLHLMLIPGVVLLFIFNYIPMYGVIIAFQKFVPAKGLFGDQAWIGLGNFQYVFMMPNFPQVLYNTLFIACMKIAVGFVFTIFVALMINEVGHKFFKRGIQTIVYFPHFLSWIIFGGILLDILSPSKGIVNMLIKSVGLDPIYFLGDKALFPWTMILTSVWKGFGFGTVVYLAAMSNVDPNLYEAAYMDGANRFQRAMHVTIPGISMVIVLIMVLNLGQVLNAGFDQIFIMMNPLVQETGDIIDTLVYRLGLEQSIYGPSTAVGLFKGVISFILISVSYLFANKYLGYRLF